ncbi:MAG: hypothetical protein ACE5JO_08270 [Candidatus Binatia bacterium]
MRNALFLGEWTRGPNPYGGFLDEDAAIQKAFHGQLPVYPYHNRELSKAQFENVVFYVLAFCLGGVAGGFLGKMGGDLWDSLKTSIKSKHGRKFASLRDKQKEKQAYYRTKFSACFFLLDSEKNESVVGLVEGRIIRERLTMVDPNDFNQALDILPELYDKKVESDEFLEKGIYGYRKEIGGWRDIEFLGKTDFEEASIIKTIYDSITEEYEQLEKLNS